MKTYKIHESTAPSRDAEVGDIINVSEIVSGVGISGNHSGEIIEVCEQTDGEAKSYLCKMRDGSLRMVQLQPRWGWAYDYFTRYKLNEE